MQWTRSEKDGMGFIRSGRQSGGERWIVFPFWILVVDISYDGFLAVGFLSMRAPHELHDKQCFFIANFMIFQGETPWSGRAVSESWILESPWLCAFTSNLYTIISEKHLTIDLIPLFSNLLILNYYRRIYYYLHIWRPWSDDFNLKIYYKR